MGLLITGWLKGWVLASMLGGTRRKSREAGLDRRKQVVTGKMEEPGRVFTQAEAGEVGSGEQFRGVTKSGVATALRFLKTFNSWVFPSPGSFMENPLRTGQLPTFSVHPALSLGPFFKMGWGRASFWGWVSL